MSTGEKSMLSLLARFYSLIANNKNINKDKVKNLIILIDEGELYFHPQWQKEYIYLLIHNLTEIFSSIKIQLILTSHSPFVLSDLPKSNVVFLRRNQETFTAEVCNIDEREQTFAANIHTLFADSFFVRNGLFGEFAKKKIEYVINAINEKDKLTKAKASELQKTIDLIGEPVINKKLNYMLEIKMKEQK
jgi:predicted ATP-binding protein involved in virulence